MRHRGLLRSFSELSGVRPGLRGPEYLDSTQKRLLDAWGSRELIKATQPLMYLARAAVSDLVAAEDSEFSEAARRVLEKNRELYERLS